MPQVFHMGALMPLGKLLSHYRLMARNDRRSSAFWRLRAHVTITEYREQCARADQRIAA